MDKKELLIKVILGLILAYILYKIYSWARQKHSLTSVVINGKEHFVRNMEDKEEAAKMMNEIKSRMEKLMKYIKDKETDDEKIDRIYSNLDIDNIKETDMNEDATSYSINKGSEFSICMREKDDESHKLHDINLLMFVTIHELAHLMSVSYGHNEEFEENFKYLLKMAIDAGVYSNVNYDNNSKNYCGMEVTDNPLF